MKARCGCGRTTCKKLVHYRRMRRFWCLLGQGSVGFRACLSAHDASQTDSGAWEQKGDSYESEIYYSCYRRPLSPPKFLHAVWGPYTHNAKNNRTAVLSRQSVTNP